MSISSIILPLLNKRPENIGALLSKLHCSTLLIDSKHTELTILGRRSLKYLQSRDDKYLIWVGCSLAKVISVNPLILSTFASDFLATLIKLLGLPTIYCNNELFNVVADTTLIICLLIKGKPSLTRETLTPNLPSFIACLVKKIEQINDIGTVNDKAIFNCISILTTLCKNHSTIFRPFGTKYENILNNILSSKSFNTKTSEFRQKVIESYVTLCLINKNPALQYKFLMSNVVKEIQCMFGLFFQTFIQLDDEDSNRIMSKINDQLNFNTDFSSHEQQHSKSMLKFTSLNIDLNEVATLNEIYDRFNVLIQILVGFMSTPLNDTVVFFPIGVIITICEVLSYISNDKYGFRKNLLIGNFILKENLEFLFLKTQLEGIYLLNFLIQIFGQSCLTYSNKIFQILDNAIPTETISSINPNTNRTSYKKILDVSKISKHKHDLLIILQTIEHYLSTLDNGDLHDFSIVLKAVDMSIILNEQETFEKLLEKQDSKTTTKHKKVKNSVELSDVIANPLLLNIKPHFEISNTTLKFFNTVLKNVPKLPMAQLIKIEKFAILQTINKIARNERISNGYISLLTTLVINSNENEKYNILPITINLLKLANKDNNELISLLLNPRFPIVNKREIEFFDKEELEKQENNEREKKLKESESSKIYTEQDLQAIKATLGLSMERQVNEKFNELKRKFMKDISLEEESKRRKLDVDLRNEEVVWTEKKDSLEINSKPLSQNEDIASKVEIALSVKDKNIETQGTDQQDDDVDDVDFDLQMPNIDIGSSDDDE